MKKLPVYEMLIDENVDSDMQVDFIALVDKPAIKKDFLKFSEDFIEPSKGERETEFIPRCISYVVNEGKDNEQAVAICYSIWEQHFAEESYNDYPDSVKNNAKAALKYAEENGWGTCGTPVGKARANQLANGEKISIETIKRMYSYLSRHEVDIESSKGYGDGCGKLMYDSWGGKSALSWAESKIKSIERKAFAIQDEERRIISGPLMVANQKIYRNDPELGEYEVFFSPETITKIAIKLAKKGFHNNVNLMHNSDMQVPGVTLFEIFQSDKSRGIMPIKGFEDLADGSLFGSMYVENDVAWKYVKDNLIKGFSVEGNFGMKKKDKYDETFEKIVEILNETNF
jgi:hypothetical protein